MVQTDVRAFWDMDNEPTAAPQALRCSQCTALFEPRENWDVACAACAAQLPPSLLKAVGDPFMYALRLRTGEVIEFECVTLHGTYATLHRRNHGSTCQCGEDAFRESELPFGCPRGLDVRIADIVWCADAPRGS